MQCYSVDRSSKSLYKIIWMSGLATRVINRSTGKGFTVFFFRHVHRWLLISPCLYFCFATSHFRSQERTCRVLQTGHSLSFLAAAALVGPSLPRTSCLRIGPSAALAGRPSECRSRGCHISSHTPHCRRKPASGFCLQSGLECCQQADGVTRMVAATGVCSPGLSVSGTLFEQVEWLSECVHLIATLHAQSLLH